MPADNWLETVRQDAPDFGAPKTSPFEQAFLASPYASVVLNWSGQVLACNRRAAQSWWQAAPGATEVIVGTRFADITTLSEDEVLQRVQNALAVGTVSIPMLHGRKSPRDEGVLLRACLLETEVLGDYRILLSQDVLRPTVQAI